MNEDAVLWRCNETELLQMARRQGLGTLRRGLPKDTLIALVGGYADPQPQHYAGTRETREILQKYIADNIERARSQLPGCDGRCTTFQCTEGRHALCFVPQEAHVR
jgi:hypothetical protein